jgi:hypothetical protein
MKAKINSNIWAAFIGIFFLVLVNLVTIAFSYGQMSERVSGLCQRIDRIETYFYQVAQGFTSQNTNWRITK